MKETSFGKMEHILKLDKKVVAEYLIFEKEGRAHKHLEYESFAVLSGNGQVVCGEEVFDVAPGDIITIPPKTEHRMIPKSGFLMTGLLWYHELAGERAIGNTTYSQQ